MFTPSEDQVDFFGGGGVEIDAKTRWVVGARYFVVPDTKDLFGALASIHIVLAHQLQ